MSHYYKDATAYRCGAQEKTRTSTTYWPLAPEASASTNSATWACREQCSKRAPKSQSENSYKR